MAIKHKSGGAYADVVDVFHKQAGVYEAVQGVYVKTAGTYGLVSGPASDPSFANVSLLLHGDGANGSTTFTDSSATPKTLTAVGPAVISTEQSKFGGSSIRLDGTGARATMPTSTAFDFGTGDFTIEAWVRFSATTDMALFSSQAVGGIDVCFLAGEMRLGRIDTSWDSTAPFVRTTGVWYHVAWARAGTSLKFFVDGVAVGTTTNSTSYGSASGGLNVGVSKVSDRPFNGWIDDLRITKGVARYTGNFTPPTAAFPDA